MDEILFAIWYFLPAGLANAAPVFAAKLPLLKHWNTPLDFGTSFRGQRIFGDHKTWRGLLFGILVAVTTAWIQHAVWNRYYLDAEWLYSAGQTLDYWTHGYLIIGALMGAGALLGDAIKSFFKRRANVTPGKSWFPFDQIDYIIGGLLLSAPFAPLTLIGYAVVFCVWFGLHLASVFIGYYLGIRESKI